MLRLYKLGLSLLSLPWVMNDLYATCSLTLFSNEESRWVERKHSMVVGIETGVSSSYATGNSLTFSHCLFTAAILSYEALPPHKHSHLSTSLYVLLCMYGNLFDSYNTPSICPCNIHNLLSVSGQYFQGEGQFKQFHVHNHQIMKNVCWASSVWRSLVHLSQGLQRCCR